MNIITTETMQVIFTFGLLLLALLTYIQKK